MMKNEDWRHLAPIQAMVSCLVFCYMPSFVPVVPWSKHNKCIVLLWWHVLSLSLNISCFVNPILDNDIVMVYDYILSNLSCFVNLVLDNVNVVTFEYLLSSHVFFYLESLHALSCFLSVVWYYRLLHLVMLFSWIQ